MDEGMKKEEPLNCYMEKRSASRNVRLEPYIDKKLGAVCRIFGISKSEAVRQGILMYLEYADGLITGTKKL